MADLKAGSTAGGSILWHQGNFPLKPVSDDVYYKTFKLYSEYNKPQAVDNDFVSKALGGTYLDSVTFNKGLNIVDKNGYTIRIDKNERTDPAYAYSAFMRIKDSFAFETEDGQPFAVFNPTKDVLKSRLTVMGLVTAREVADESGRVFSPGNPPTNIQVGLGNVTNDLQVKLLDPGLQTMVGILGALNFNSTNAASQPQHVPRFDQIVIKDSIQDFGYYS